MNLVLRLTTLGSNTMYVLLVDTCQGLHGAVLERLKGFTTAACRKMAGFLEALSALLEALTAPSELN